MISNGYINKGCPACSLNTSSNKKINKLDASNWFNWRPERWGCLHMWWEVAIFDKDWLLNLLKNIYFFTFSKDRKDIKSLNQEVVGGAFGHFQCKRIRLRAMREAKATTSEFFLMRLVGVQGTPKMEISGQGSNLILRALFHDLKKT